MLGVALTSQPQPPAASAPSRLWALMSMGEGGGAEGSLVLAFREGVKAGALAASPACQSCPPEWELVVPFLGLPMAAQGPVYLHFLPSEAQNSPRLSQNRAEVGTISCREEQPTPVPPLC